jgi:glycosyltransferase involved in cell wall biosynthesis
VIAGEGPERAALEARAAELGVAAEFTGYVERPEEALAGFDVFALSSDTEQMPLSVVEAMAAGLPVASVQVGDVMEMVAPENRPFIAPAGDGAGLGRAIAALLDDHAARARIGAANAARARALYDEATMVAAYDALWRG